MAMSLVVELGEDLLQRVVVARSEKRKRRGERAGATPVTTIEFRARACSGPARKNAGTEGAVGAAAG